MMKTKSRLDELKKEAMVLIDLDVVSERRVQLARIIADGIDDTFNPENSDTQTVDEYLRDRALNLWFYPSMHLDQLIPKLTVEIDQHWEIKPGDRRMMQDCLAVVMNYRPSRLKVTLGEFLGADDATKVLTTLEGFDLAKINQYLVDHDVRTLPTD